MEKIVFFERWYVTLIKSSLSNLSTYFMSIFHILIGFARKLEKLQTDISYGPGLGDERKFSIW